MLLAFSYPGLSQVRPGAWLDSPPRRWNKPGMSLPHAPTANRDKIAPVCKPLPDRRDTTEESALTDAGWLVFISKNDGHGLTVVGASADLDGMCRPNRYQDFAFVNGKFAGTLSPKLMNARSDGASSTVSFASAGKIIANFSRYTGRDPLCCPSAISVATYEIREDSGRPIVVLTGVYTHTT